ncbi:crossover junction endodeoxyribonuclease RuvC [Candidatus Woesebacteria bacterium]|nr:crossover junction endodeoxyribonuclease RuvC [Candidatus Woesebacteria bacterium]MCD8527462.1 crossover junction endodeoxyribonuclease RuvC [Candidatus Woesebacteria bacterium]MCD8546204.1 crossover junction endodeoxyribonuclease RuvC [Candidatus Woesebacteria bacterium]
MTAKPFRQLILGIDPGYDRCGWAIVAQQNTALKAVEYGCVQTSAKDEKADRFRQIWRQMDHLFAQYPIDVIAIESLFFSRNVSTALPVSEVRGLIFAQSFLHAIPVAEYAPNTIKMAVTGQGNAPKDQMLGMVYRLLKLEKIPNLDDTGDALAAAVTHASHWKTGKIL